MQNTTTRLMLALVMGACLALTGCEDDGGGSSPANVAGSWAFSDSSGASGTLMLVQNGSSLTGSIGGIPLTGEINGNSITLRVQDGIQSTATGTVSGNQMSGTFTSTEDSGTWQAVRN